MFFSCILAYIFKKNTFIPEEYLGEKKKSTWKGLFF